MAINRYSSTRYGTPTKKKPGDLAGAAPATIDEILAADDPAPAPPQAFDAPESKAGNQDADYWDGGAGDEVAYEGTTSTDVWNGGFEDEANLAPDLPQADPNDPDGLAGYEEADLSQYLGDLDMESVDAELAALRMAQEDEQRAIEQRLAQEKMQALGNASARAGLGGLGLSGATAALLSDIGSRQDNAGALTLADLGRGYRDEARGVEQDAFDRAAYLDERGFSRASGLDERDYDRAVYGDERDYERELYEENAEWARSEDAEEDAIRDSEYAYESGRREGDDAWSDAQREVTLATLIQEYGMSEEEARKFLEEQGLDVSDTLLGGVTDTDAEMDNAEALIEGAKDPLADLGPVDPADPAQKLDNVLSAIGVPEDAYAVAQTPPDGAERIDNAARAAPLLLGAPWLTALMMAVTGTYDIYWTGDGVVLVPHAGVDFLEGS